MGKVAVNDQNNAGASSHTEILMHGSGATTGITGEVFRQY